MKDARPRRDVPCGLCRQCCYHEHVFLRPEYGDDISAYRSVDIYDEGEMRVRAALAKRADGACVYLGADGCTIHDRAPSLCRSFDCKRLYQRLEKLLPPTQLEAMARSSPVVDVGRRRAKGMRP